MKNINIHLDLIVGLPYETLTIFEKSFNDVYSLKPHQLQIGFLKLLSGSPFEKMVNEHNYIFSGNPPYEILSNKYITNDEIIYLKQFEDCFNRLYNSGRFVESLKYLNGYFENSFKMYKSIADYFEKSNTVFKSISSRNLYDILAKYAEKIQNINIIDFKQKLLLDYFSSDPSDTVPVSLRDIADFSKSAKEKIKKYLLDSDFPKESFYTGRFVNNRCYFFNYESKNPVNGLYPIVKQF